jgi:LysM repeat protein
VLKRLLASLLVPVLLAVPAPASAATVWHVVAPGQTLSAVAAAHGLSVAEIARWNQIVAPYPLYVDEVLRLTPPSVPLSSWRTRVEPVTPAMVGWDPARKCPVPPASLRRVWVSYIDLRGGYHDGSIIVRQDLVRRTQRAFFTLFRRRYRIMAMAPMAVNLPGVTDMSIVTAGYNCRPVAGTSTWSQHAYGTAIDVNPLQNPMIRGRVVDPGSLYLRRSHYWIGMMHEEGAVRAFTENGFYWGGNWTSLKDYMHFSTTNK